MLLITNYTNIDCFFRLKLNKKKLDDDKFDKKILMKLDDKKMMTKIDEIGWKKIEWKKLMIKIDDKNWW